MVIEAIHSRIFYSIQVELQKANSQNRHQQPAAQERDTLALRPTIKDRPAR
jgi:hypothetical protein